MEQILITRRRRLLSKGRLCKDCGKVIDNIDVKGMKCISCGKLVCFKCNMGYKCHDCYIESRQDYYSNLEIQKEDFRNEI